METVDGVDGTNINKWSPACFLFAVCMKEQPEVT